MSLKDNGLSPDQQMLALRYVLDRFGAQASDRSRKGSDDRFDQLMNKTQNRALELTQTVANGSFTLQYQPILDLATGGVAHYEALSRFSENANTGEIVGFAEALGIADAFDLAVAIKIIARWPRRTAANRASPSTFRAARWHRRRRSGCSQDCSRGTGRWRRASDGNYGNGGNLRYRRR